VKTTPVFKTFLIFIISASLLGCIKPVPFLEPVPRKIDFYVSKQKFKDYSCNRLLEFASDRESFFKTIGLSTIPYVRDVFFKERVAIENLTYRYTSSRVTQALLTPMAEANILSLEFAINEKNCNS